MSVLCPTEKQDEVSRKKDGATTRKKIVLLRLCCCQRKRVSIAFKTWSLLLHIQANNHDVVRSRHYRVQSGWTSLAGRILHGGIHARRVICECSQCIILTFFLPVSLFRSTGCSTWKYRRWCARKGLRRLGSGEACHCKVSTQNLKSCVSATFHTNYSTCFFFYFSKDYKTVGPFERLLTLTNTPSWRLPDSPPTPAFWWIASASKHSPTV